MPCGHGASAADRDRMPDAAPERSRRGPGRAARSWRVQESAQRATLRNCPWQRNSGRLIADRNGLGERHRRSRVALVGPGLHMQPLEQHAHELILAAPGFGNGYAVIQYREVDRTVVAAAQGADQRAGAVLPE